MVLGLGSKNKRGTSVHVDYQIYIHEIKPWPPSQSLRSLRSVIIQWENGERNSGSTSTVVPTLGSVVGEGKIEFNESFDLPVTLSRDTSGRSKENDTFLKNVLEFNLYEPRREKALQLLATATIDLADYGVVKETLSVSAPMNSKRSFRNTAQPVLFLTIQPVDKHCTKHSTLSKRVSMENNGGESVSALMNEEYAEEAEIASFTDDDVSSHSSLTVSSSTLESNGGIPPRNKEEERERATNNAKGNGQENNMLPQMEQPDGWKNGSSPPLSSIDTSSGSSDTGKVDVCMEEPSSASSMSKQQITPNMESNDNENSVNEHRKVSMTKSNSQPDIGKDTSNSYPTEKISDCADRDWCIEDDELLNVSLQPVDRTQVSNGLDMVSSSGGGQVDRSKNVMSVRSSSDVTRSNGITGDSQNAFKSTWSNERKDVNIYPKDSRNAILEKKIQQLEGKIKMLEGELREAAAIEAALYSVVAEHGSSMSKVYAPARRLSRLYRHACREGQPSRRATAARSAVSGLVLVAKACGNDVPRLTFWLSNSVVLRAIISQVNGEEKLPLSAGLHMQRNRGEKESKKKPSPLKWKESSPNRKDVTIYEKFGDWDESSTFTTALEKVEAWIFSRIVESIWWQTLTPHMQSAATKAFNKVTGSSSKKNFGRTSSSFDQEQANFSLDLWKKAFRDACERLCPLRAGGHECGCLPMLTRLIMEQCIARLDVALFNAILRESDDHIPTDPVSDPIGDPKVLPIPAGKSSFGAGAQLKNAIGNWSRWLTDLFGIDDDDATENQVDDDYDHGRHDTSFKSFHLLKALSDLMMLPKDMLLNKSIRKEVCPMFGAPLIKRVLNSFVTDEFCPDPVPDSVLEALESEEPDEAEEELVTNYPCLAAPPIYSPPSATSVTGSLGEFGSQSHPLRRSGSSVVRKSYTSDDELDELNSPLASILPDTSRPLPLLSMPSWASKESHAQNAVRYELLGRIWINSE